MSTIVCTRAQSTVSATTSTMCMHLFDDLFAIERHAPSLVLNSLGDATMDTAAAALYSSEGQERLVGGFTVDIYAGHVPIDLPHSTATTGTSIKCHPAMVE